MSFKAGPMVLLTIFIGSIISACSDRKVPLHSVYSSANCPFNKQVIKQINSQSELNQLFESQPANFISRPLSNIEVDFEKQTLLVIALGQKPTAGYGLQLEKNEAVVRGEKLFLPLRVLEPDKNKIYAQMITSPCQIFSAPHAEYVEIVLN
jgi:hypothetical protein